MTTKTFATLLLSVATFYTNEAFAQSTITMWKDSAIGAIYNAATQTVAYGKKGSNGYYKIYLSDTLGNNEQQLTWPAWPSDRHQWAEEWYPTGDYLFCYVEKTAYAFEAGHLRLPDDAIPGYGAYTDIWLIKRDGSQAWQLTNYPNNYDNGVIHGAISPDGSLFAWSQRIAAPVAFDLNLTAGAYVMNVAQFIDGPTPTINIIHTFQPGGILAANELENISPDNSTLTFYSTYQTLNLFNTPVYKTNMNSQQITQLTTESFAQAPAYTPDGSHLVYMTGKDCDIFPFEIQGADWWVMDTSGNNKNRITRMNVLNDPQSVNHYRLAGSLSFMRANTFLGSVMTTPLGLTGHTVKVEFSSALVGLNEIKPARFKIYPNPTADILSIMIENKKNEMFEVYNSYGQMVKQFLINQTTQINITDLPSGLYFVRIKNYPQQTIKFIKQ